MRAAVIGFLSVCMLALMGCTSMASRDDSRATLKELTPDELYIARVEENARRRGIRVTWIHLPQSVAPETVEKSQE